MIFYQKALIISSILLFSLFVYANRLMAQTEKALDKVPGQTSSDLFKQPFIIDNPDDRYSYSAHSRKFTGIPSLVITEAGTTWVTWYGGVTPHEDANNYVIVASSKDKGKTWQERFVIDPDKRGPVRAFDPEIWISPDNRLWVFWAQMIRKDGVYGVWAMETSDIDSEKPVWSRPKRLCDGIMMNKPLVLKNGDWLLPVSTWMTTRNSAQVVVSADQGKSWSLRGACDVPAEFQNCDEHMVVQLRDGSLRMLVRTLYGIGETTSKDEGKTWSALKRSDIEHKVSRFFLTRLKSGNLLLVKHGPIEQQLKLRSHLMAFISKDDGKSWSKGLLLDERTGVSYPDGMQASDGRIYITYDYDRRGQQEILMTSFTESDVLSPDYDSRIITVAGNRKLVSKGGH